MHDTSNLLSLVTEEEVLRHVVGYLDILERWMAGWVCRGLRRVVRGPCERVVLMGTARRGYGRIVRNIVERGGSKVVDLDGLEGEGVEGLLVALWGASHTTAEYVSFKYMPAEVKGGSMGDWSRLETLCLRGCTDAPVALLLQHCPALTSLNLRGCGEKDVLEALATHPPPSGLRRLCVGWASEFRGTPAAINSYYDSAEWVGVLRQAAGACPRLEHLEVPGITSVTAGILQDFPSLMSLDCSNCKLLNNTLSGLLPQTAFKHLSLRATSVTDATMLSIAAHCTDLTFINVSCTPITDEGIAAITQGCPHVTHFDLCYPEGAVSQGGVLQICKTYTESLQLLGVAGLLQDVVTDDLVEACVALCPNIEMFALGGNSALTVRVWEVLRCLPRLARIIAHNLTIVSYADLMTLGDCTRLSQVDLFNVALNRSLTEDQLNVLLERYPFDWYSY